MQTQDDINELLIVPTQLPLILIKIDALWNKYLHIISMDVYECDQFMKIIIKIRNGETDFREDAETFIKLLKRMSNAIYYYEKYNEEYDEEYDEDMSEQTIDLYNNSELKLCYRMCQYLLSKIN